jgi:hypothetical protein
LYFELRFKRYELCKFRTFSAKTEEKGMARDELGRTCSVLGGNLDCVGDGNFGPRGRWLRRKKRRAEAQLVADLRNKKKVGPKFANARN